MSPLSFFYFLLLGDAGTIAFMMHHHPSVFRIRVKEQQKEAILHVSVSTNNDSWNDSSSSNNNGKKKLKKKRQEQLSFPWTEFQDWALRDNIAKYLVSVPHSDSAEPQLYGLWRTLSNEVVELSGYPVEFLRQRYIDLQQEQAPSLTPAILPLLDEYEFETSGGLSGRVYGIPGVADGSKIKTTALRDIQTTLPKGYILTDDQEIIYELGSPISVSYSMDGENIKIPNEGNKITANHQGAVVGSAISRAGEITAEVTSDDMLIRLGATTGIVLAGATAFNMLSHHLTVNIFWT